MKIDLLKISTINIKNADGELMLSIKPDCFRSTKVNGEFYLTVEGNTTSWATKASLEQKKRFEKMHQEVEKARYLLQNLTSVSVEESLMIEDFLRSKTN